MRLLLQLLSFVLQGLLQLRKLLLQCCLLTLQCLQHINQGWALLTFTQACSINAMHRCHNNKRNCNNLLLELLALQHRPHLQGCFFFSQGLFL